MPSFAGTFGIDLAIRTRTLGELEPQCLDLLRRSRRVNRNFRKTSSYRLEFWLGVNITRNNNAVHGLQIHPT